VNITRHIYIHIFYKFEIVDKSQAVPKNRTIELRFDKENFCHLFGIESIVRWNVRDIRIYKGKLGWDNVKNGSIDFSDLKKKINEGLTITKLGLFSFIWFQSL
jgi:hypothetical protein